MKYKITAQFFKALSHPTRIMIINELLDKRICVNDIEEILGLKQPNISQHLSLLRLLNIVDYKKDGNKKCYFINNKDLIRDILKIVKKIEEEEGENKNAMDR
ncbi:MAG TPA: ArsR family transcriptional regulator [Actinobacteria bacterium]|nr:ArsR family transcriptional regulator [Actinomycetota bacterium]